MQRRTWQSAWLGWRGFAVMLGYVAVVISALSMYEPWEDEGRAWMIARSFGLWEMLFHILRYEGHPALWYLLLWAPAHLHVPFVAINGLSVALGCLGVWVLLRYAPFPFWLRAVLPFGFWLVYQYAVVAREYALFPLVGFTVAHFYRCAPARPTRMALALGLLANASFYGALVAIGFGIAYAQRLTRIHRNGAAPGLAREARWGAALFAGALLFLAICVWPPRSLHSPLSPAVRKTLGHVIPVEYLVTQQPVAAERIPGTAAAHDVESESRLGTRLNLVFVYPIAGSVVASVVLGLLVVVFLFRRGEALLVLPPLLLCSFMATIYCKLWHAGLVWVTLVMVMWAAWDAAEGLRWKSPQAAMGVLMAAIGLVQAAWTLGAISYETGHSTYPAEAAAKYLKTLPPGITLDGNGYAFTIVPYFDSNPFTGYNPERYVHYAQYPEDESPRQMISFSPQVILLRGEKDGRPREDDARQLEPAGYRALHAFCGATYFPNQAPRPLCLVAYEHLAAGPPR